jgi:putative membrane protein
MKIILSGLMAATAVCGLSMAAPSAADAQRGMAAPQRASMTYVAKAGAGDLYEIQSSQIAVRRARDPRIREFAAMLVTDHQRTTQEVLAAARASGMRPGPAMLEPAQRQMIRQLERAPAAQFDRLYIRQQIPAHQQALALHQRYARTGSAPALRRVASGAIPVVQGHLAHARQMAR